MMACLACSRVAKRWPWTQAVFNRPQKLSMGELSQQLPLRLMDERMPQPANVAWKLWLQYWVDSTGRRNTKLSYRF